MSIHLFPIMHLYALHYSHAPLYGPVSRQSWSWVQRCVGYISIYFLMLWRSFRTACNFRIKTELGGRRTFVMKYQSFCFFGQFLERKFILLLVYVKIFVTVSSRCVMTDPFTGYLVLSFFHDCWQCYLRFQNNVITLLVLSAALGTFSKLQRATVYFIMSVRLARPVYIFSYILLISCQNEKCFRQKLQRISKHTFYVQ